MNKLLEKNETLQNMTIPEKIVYINNTCSQITSHPEDNLYKLQNLLNLLKSNNLFIIKIVGLSMAEIFKDICPMFPLDKKTMEEKLKQVINKEERRLINHEYMILTLYEKYLQEMYKIKEFLKSQDKSNLREFEIVLVQSFSELYKKLYYFNFNTDIINLLLKYMLSKNQQIHKLIVNFIDYILKTENESFYKSKLLILEKLGFFLKKNKLFELINEDIWECYTDIRFQYAEEVDNKLDKVKKQEDYIDKMKNLKDQGKLSKRRLKELQGKEEILEKMQYKKQKEEEKKKLMKVINKELQEQDALITSKKVKKIAKQILLQIFYINLKVLKDYPDKQALIWCLRSIDKNYKKVDPVFLQDLQLELKNQFEYFGNKSKIEVKLRLQKQLMILNIIIKIAQQKNMGLEIEEYYSTSCFYQILIENLKNCNLFQYDKKSQLQVVYLLENLLLNKKIFNKDVLESFTRIIFMNYLLIKDDILFQTMIFFLKVFFDVSQQEIFDILQKAYSIIRRYINQN